MYLNEDSPCGCGKYHKSSVGKTEIGSGAISALPRYIKDYKAEKVFLLSDANTYKAAGESVCKLLDESNISYTAFVYKDAALEPDEKTVGSVVMHFDNECDIIVGVGSGVINDTGKILAKISGRPYIIAATAPSMDGYASATSSVIRDGCKISLAAKSADVIIGDINILKAAPDRMLLAGIGDMLAKYISICEWRIANLITGEYYCENVANIVRTALKKCADNAKNLLARDDDAIKAVFEGLVISGVAMNYAGLSRPASGCEHYFSHIWDMRGLEFGTNVDLHGIQCAVGTVYAARLYERLKQIKPDRHKAAAYVEKFDYSSYKGKLISFLGNGAEAMIALEKQEGKYDAKKHSERLEIIISKWDEILAVINDEIPGLNDILNIFGAINLPDSADKIGIDADTLRMTFEATKDIRDKYVISRLCWDLGILDEIEI